MRAILIVIDSFGVGALPDAGQYGDVGANTALHICEAIREVLWPNLQHFGLGNCASLLGYDLPGCEMVERPLASYGVMSEGSAGKDTITGHWELAGIILEKPFTTFPLHYPAFPQELLEKLSEATGYKIIGNIGASGTAIIESLGAEHLGGQGLIVYTSADSVMQIAAHEEVVPLDELYSICETARKLCDPYRVGRVIARPFTGSPGNFTRTRGRRDFSMALPGKSVLDVLSESNIETIGIGKIGDIFNEQGLERSYHDKGNSACLDRLVACLESNAEKSQFLFINLVDTDMLYGHRRDIRGYHDSVQQIDMRLPEILDLMSPQDLLIITADHGCDPGFKGSDHTREYVPLLVYKEAGASVSLGIRQSFSDVAQSLTLFFDVTPMDNGESFVE